MIAWDEKFIARKTASLFFSIKYNNMTVKDSTTENPKMPATGTAPVSRRKFFTYAGLSAATVIAATACTKEQRDYFEPKPKDAVDLGSGDIGILNYAYALEQLEAAFYIKVCSAFYDGATAKEKMYLDDVQRHEIAHREFFKNALEIRPLVH